MSADRGTWADLLPTLAEAQLLFSLAEPPPAPPSIAPNYLLIVILHVWPRPGPGQKQKRTERAQSLGQKVGRRRRRRRRRDCDLIAGSGKYQVPVAHQQPLAWLGRIGGGWPPKTKK